MSWFLSVKVGRNKHIKRAVMVDAKYRLRCMCTANFNLKNKNTKKYYSPLDFYLPKRVHFAPLYTSPDVVQNLLSNWL